MYHPLNDYLIYFVAFCSSRTLAVLGELALVISRYRTDQFSRSVLPDAVCL